MAKSDAGFAQVIGRHLDAYLIADADANEVFAHLSGNMSEHRMPIGQRHSEHRARQYLSDSASNLDWLFFHHRSIIRQIFVTPERLRPVRASVAPHGEKLRFSR